MPSRTPMVLIMTLFSRLNDCLALPRLSAKPIQVTQALRISVRFRRESRDCTKRLMVGLASFQCHHGSLPRPQRERHDWKRDFNQELHKKQFTGNSFRRDCASLLHQAANEDHQSADWIISHRFCSVWLHVWYADVKSWWSQVIATQSAGSKSPLKSSRVLWCGVCFAFPIFQNSSWQLTWKQVVALQTTLCVYVWFNAILAL